MKILLIRPQQIHWNNEEKRVAQPLGLLYLAGTLRKSGYEIDFIDATVEGFNSEVEIKKGLYKYGLSDDELERQIREICPNVVGIESNFTYFWNQAKEIANLVKKIDNRIVTILGGHHITSIEKETLQQNSTIDYVISGEGELKFLELINELSNKSPNKINKIHNLDDLADPAFDLLKSKLYVPKMSTYIETNKRFFIYLSERGCNYDCSFCTTPKIFGRRSRLFSIDRIKDHIKKIKELGFEEIVFEDDNFFGMPRDYRKEYYQIPKKLGLTAFHDAGFYYPKIKREDIEDLAEAGIYGIFLPVENYNMDIMHKQGKYVGMTKEGANKKIEEVTKWLKNAKMIFYIGTMIGFPDESKRDLENAVEYAKFLKNLGAIAVTFHWVHPYSATELYRMYYNLVPSERRFETAPEFWNFIKPVLPLKDISLEDAEEYINKKFFEINGIVSRNPSYYFKIKQ